MRARLVMLTALTLVACSSPAMSPEEDRDPTGAPSVAAGCYALQLEATPSPDVSLPSLIELSTEPAPGFVESGRFAVREPGASRQAPISWWRQREAGELELALGGGYTGYTFILEAAAGGGWAGEGSYCADFGVEPAPPLLPARLTPRTCP